MDYTHATPLPPSLKPSSHILHIRIWIFILLIMGVIGWWLYTPIYSYIHSFNDTRLTNSSKKIDPVELESRLFKLIQLKRNSSSEEFLQHAKDGPASSVTPGISSIVHTTKKYAPLATTYLSTFLTPNTIRLQEPAVDYIFSIQKNTPLITNITAKDVIASEEAGMRAVVSAPLSEATSAAVLNIEIDENGQRKTAYQTLFVQGVQVDGLFIHKSNIYLVVLIPIHQASLCPLSIISLSTPKVSKFSIDCNDIVVPRLDMVGDHVHALIRIDPHTSSVSTEYAVLATSERPVWWYMQGSAFLAAQSYIPSFETVNIEYAKSSEGQAVLPDKIRDALKLLDPEKLAPLQSKLKVRKIFLEYEQQSATSEIQQIKEKINMVISDYAKNTHLMNGGVIIVKKSLSDHQPITEGILVVGAVMPNLSLISGETSTAILDTNPTKQQILLFSDQTRQLQSTSNIDGDVIGVHGDVVFVKNDRTGVVTVLNKNNGFQKKIELNTSHAITYIADCDVSGMYCILVSAIEDQPARLYRTNIQDGSIQSETILPMQVRFTEVRTVREHNALLFRDKTLLQYVQVDPNNGSMHTAVFHLAENESLLAVDRWLVAVNPKKEMRILYTMRD